MDKTGEKEKIDEGGGKGRKKEGEKKRGERKGGRRIRREEEENKVMEQL